MMEFINEIRSRNSVLFVFGAVSWIFAIIFLVLSATTEIKVQQVNAWYKPFKFAVSIAMYAWSMAWFVHYLQSWSPSYFQWTVVIMFGFEIVYIGWKAAQGEQSHFNVSTPFHSAMYAMMAIAASVVTAYTAYFGYLFFVNDFPELPSHYITAIRWGIVIFVIFSFQGFLMGSRLSHTIGGADGGPGLPILNWSTKWGDARVAHFIGMHALQILPLLAYYLFKNTRVTMIAVVFYLLLAVAALVQALKGRPLVQLQPPSDQHSSAVDEA
ncbi:MAG: hypothetical protein RLZZ262_344 [Bacteroidota bacterium]|jgi:hypothetical protein